MLSIGKLAAGPAAGRYYEEAVARGREDYYADRGETPGVWLGAGAAKLGADGTVGDGQVNQLLAGQHPTTGVLLGRAMGDRSVAGFDLTFKAPKSISVLFGVGDDALATRLISGHEVALREALGYLEREACGARRGTDGVQKVAGRGFVAAAFRHQTSRAGDPLLHTHMVIANRVQGPDGRWTALDGQLLYAHAKTAGFVYQAALRHKLGEELGLSWDAVGKGTAEVAGLTPELLRHFSQRRQEIEATMAERGEHSPNAARTAALATRKGKDYRVSIGELRETWRYHAAEHGLDHATLRDLLDAPRERTEPQPVALNDLTRHASTFTRRDVVQAVAAAHRDGARVVDLEREADELLVGPEVVAVERRSGERAYTTADMLRTERELLDRARDGRDAERAIARPDLVEAALERRGLDGEQAELVRALTSEGHAIHVVRAPAGTGKTFALEAAKEAWVRSGVEVTGCALSARAAAELRDQATLETTTIARLRLALDGGQRLPVCGVLIVDEAGMVGTRDLAELSRRAEEVYCKLVLVGDDRQLPEIEAGGAFGSLAERSGATELSILRRQRDEEERRALQALRQGRTREWAQSLGDRDRLVTAPTADAVRERLTSDWWEAHQAGHDAIMVAHRRRDVADLNDRARHHLREHGRLTGPDVDLGGRAYAIGDEIACRRNDRDIDVINGTTGRICELTAGWMRVDLGGDREVLLPAAYAAEHVDHAYATTAHRAQGATVDQAFVLGSDELHREWGYTAMTRHRDQARFYLTTPEPYLNREALPIERQEELAEAVARLFETTKQQELALEALERMPEAASVLQRMDQAAAQADALSADADRFEAEHAQTSRLRWSERRALQERGTQARGQAEAHLAQLDGLAEALDALRADPTAQGVPVRAYDPVDLTGVHDPGLDLGADLDMGP